MSKDILLKNLKLKNFKGIKELTLDFSKVTNIYGDNGTGKTTIADGFMWLLFDKDSFDRAAFEIKTLDSNNNVLHGLEHEVTGVLSIDGRPITLTKTYKEKWIKKRGETDRELTGHETLYYIDEIPVKKSEYQEKISSIVDEQLFKLISNPLYFSTNMKWQDRRATLLNIIGDITADRIINYNSSLEPLVALLNNTDIEILKRSISARRKKLNDDIKSLPYRIDECNNSIKDFDFEALELRKRGIQTGIESINEQIADSSKVNDEVLKEKDKVYNLKSQLKDMEYSLKDKAQKPLKELNKMLSGIETAIFTYRSKADRLTMQIDFKNKDISELEKGIQQLRNDWNKVNQEALTIPEDSFICPTCQRPFEESDIETKKQKMTENFNQNKAKRLTGINSLGMAKKEDLEKSKEELQQALNDFEIYDSKLTELTAEKEEIKAQIAEFVPSLDFSNNDEYQELKKQIEELESNLQQPKETSNLTYDLRNRKRDSETELQEVNVQLAYKEHNLNMKERIKQLEDDERRIAQQIAELEGQEFLCEEFTKTKVELLESSINNKFKLVKFKLFNTLVNGSIDDCCEALIDGVPFSNANKASQINAGLDIINALSEYYNVSAPIFIDNRESVNQILDCNSQIINLIVSNDKNLKIQSLESEVA